MIDIWSKYYLHIARKQLILLTFSKPYNFTSTNLKNLKSFSEALGFLNTCNF
jgi:hypothetical protein